MMTHEQPAENIVFLKRFDTRLTAFVVAYASIALCFEIWFFTYTLLADARTSNQQKIIGVCFVAAFSLFLGIACIHSFITALFYRRALILLNGRLGTAYVRASRVDWQTYCEVREIREVVVANDKRTYEVWIVTHAHQRIALLSGSRTFIQNFAQQVMREIGNVKPDLPCYREELIGYSGTPRAHQPIYTGIQVSRENGCDAIRIPYGRVRRYRPNAKRSWFASNTQTLNCPGLMVHISGQGIQLECQSYSEELTWENIASYQIKTEDIQVPESGTNTVHWLVLNSPSENSTAISGMSGPDAEWLLFLMQQKINERAEAQKQSTETE